MVTPTHICNARTGFALVVVLGGLAVLTAIFAVTGSRVFLRLKTTQTEAFLVSNAQTARDLLQIVISHDPAPTSGASPNPIGVSLNGETYTIRLVDVGGLIDLNTAAPELLDRLASGLELPDMALEDYRRWRRTPYRLLRASDFLRISGADQYHREKLVQVATVYSGRRGIDPENAPLAVLEMLTDVSGARDALEDAVPERLRSPASGSNFNVFAEFSGSEAGWLLGTVHFGADREQNRILWIN